VDVCVAQAAGLDADQDLPGARLRGRYLRDLQWLGEALDDGCSHDALLSSS
jgi:hypothetical protein